MACLRLFVVNIEEVRYLKYTSRLERGHINKKIILFWGYWWSNYSNYDCELLIVSGVSKYLLSFHQLGI